MKLVFVLAVAASLQSGADAAERKIHRENTEWTDAWFPSTNAKDGLPKVLLIGDSITRAYFGGVEKGLEGKAHVCRIATSKAIGDPALPQELALLMSENEFQVVHLNIGMHGWDYTEEEYKEYLPEVVEAVRKAAPKAKLVWGMTTPVRKDREKGAANDRIIRRNAIAKEYFSSQGIPVDDLHGLMVPHTDLHSDDIHFNPEGSALLAKHVVDSIVPLLPIKP